MSRRRAQRFEGHLMECELCWAEVSQARLGRSLAEASRELAPPELRERIRLLAAGGAASSRPGKRVALVAGCVAAAMFLAGGAVLGFDRSGQPRPIAEAIAAFRDGRVPDRGQRSHQAPDLSGLGFTLVSSGAGEVGKIPVDAFSYRRPGGGRILIYLSPGPFPVAKGAKLSAMPQGPWSARNQGVSLLCAQHPLPLLALSEDRPTLERLASYLGVR